MSVQYKSRVTNENLYYSFIEALNNVPFEMLSLYFNQTS